MRPWIRLQLLLFAVLTASTLWAAEEKAAEKRIQVLEERLQRLEERLDRLIEVLASQRSETPAVARETAAALREEAELAAQELAAVNGSPRPSASPGKGQAAGAQQNPQPTLDEIPEPKVPINGYMEMHLNHDGINPTTLDFHRFVLLFGYNFSDRIQFVSELELEHGFVEGAELSGELELEQAFLNFRLHPKANFRAGMMLTPVGIINLYHEPTSFNGVERPFLDTVILPSTWSSNGAGLVGDLGKGFHYQAFVMSPLNGSFFSTDEGLRGGRQKGFFENVRNAAAVGRLEYRGLPGLNLGASYWAGETGFDFRDVSGKLQILEFDGRFSRGRFDARGQFVLTDLDEAARINRVLQLTTGVNPNLAEQMRGYYLEGAFHLLPSGSAHDLVAFYRYEDFNTQHKMPAGFLPIPQFDRSAQVIGLGYFPHPDVALKFDYTFLDSASIIIDTPNQWNFGVGWWF